MFPEYAKRGLISLEVELRDLLPLTEAICVARAISLTRELLSAESVLKRQELDAALGRLTIISDQRWTGLAAMSRFDMRLAAGLKQPKPNLDLCPQQPAK